MNENIRKRINTYRRGLENTKIRNSIYMLILCITLFIFGFFGIWTLSKVIFEKLAVMEELTTLNNELENKISILENMRSQFVEVQPYIVQLETAIPASPGVDSYMLMLVNAASTVGFKQRNLAVNSNNNAFGKINLNVDFQGAHSQIGVLASYLEDLPRLTLIKELSYNLKEATANVDIILEIFYVPN